MHEVADKVGFPVKAEARNAIFEGRGEDHRNWWQGGRGAGFAQGLLGGANTATKEYSSVFETPQPPSASSGHRLSRVERVSGYRSS